MKRWLWFILALLISTGTYFTIRYGLRPKPIPILNPTSFENLEQVGAVIYRRLRQEILNERLILLGSSAEITGFEELWNGFLKTAVADKIKIDVFFQRENVSQPLSPAPWETILFNDSMLQSGVFFSQVKARLKAGHLVVIHGLNFEVTHLVKTSISRELDAVTQHPVLAISTWGLTLKPDEQEKLRAQCLMSIEEHVGDMTLGCVRARVAKTLLKKKRGTLPIWAVMQRHGLKEYLLFIHRD